MGKPVVPVMVKTVALEGILSGVQYADFTEGDTVDFGIRRRRGFHRLRDATPTDRVPRLPIPASEPKPVAPIRKLRRVPDQGSTG